MLSKVEPVMSEPELKDHKEDTKEESDDELLNRTPASWYHYLYTVLQTCFSVYFVSISLYMSDMGWEYM